MPSDATSHHYVAVITGGTKGIGLGIAHTLANRGASVALTYLGDREAAERAEGQIKPALSPGKRVMLLQGDAGNPVDVDRHCAAVREKLGPINILVNNAGIMPQMPFESITDHIWEDTIRVNLGSAFYWSSRVIPDMKQCGFGRIVNVSSLAARGGGVVGPHYAASKAGMLGLTRYAAKELGQYGVTVNALAPAFIEDAGIFAGWTEDKRTELKGKVFTNRIGNVNDIVRAFEYLLDSPYVTGVCLDICGGAFMI